jgi:HSP20 family molecular chaperone IbpA
MSPSPFHGIFSFGPPQESTQLTELPEPQNWQNVAPAVPQNAPPPPPAQRPMGQIAVDIYEQDDYYIIRAPIAGVRMSDLDIEVDDRVVTIRGSRKNNDTIPENQFYLQECFWGDFSRSVTMPCSVDPRKVKATFSKDCVLKILIPKEERVKIVRISEGI